jgi:hypothetical protein
MGKEEIKKRQTEILDLIKGFTDEKLDAEYFELSKNLLMKLGRKREVPFVRGRLDIWAGGIIYAIGSINFLFDKASEPYVSATEIADYFNSSKSTVASKAKTIKDLTKMDILDPEFSTEDMKDSFNNQFSIKDNDFINNVIKSNKESITPKSLVNTSEVTDESISFVQRMALKFGMDEETINETIIEQFSDEYSGDEFNMLMDIINTPLSDDDLNGFDTDFDFDDDEDYDDDYFDDDYDELDEFDDEFDYLNILDDFDIDFDDDEDHETNLIADLSYDINFFEASRSLIKFFTMMLSRFKKDYIGDKSSNDFDFNKDLAILYTEKHDKTTNAFNRVIKRFNKALKIYNKDKIKFLDMKLEFDDNIQFNGEIESIENKTIPFFERYLSDIDYIKKFTKKIMAVDNKQDTYNNFKAILKLVLNELLDIEKYYEELINKLKNIKRPFSNLQKYIDDVAVAYYDFMEIYKSKKRDSKNNEILKAMTNFIGELNLAEEIYKMDLDEFKLLEDRTFKELKNQTQVRPVDFKHIEKANKESIKVYKSIIKDFNSLIKNLNKKSKTFEDKKTLKQLIKSLENSINILNTFIKDIGEQSKIIDKIKKSSKY